MPSAHDAASLNEISANSAIASRALVCEKLGRNDVDISCVHPLVFAFVFVACCFSFDTVECNPLCFPHVLGTPKVLIDFWVGGMKMELEVLEL